MIESNIKAKLSFSDGTPDIELPIYKGTQGPDVIDIRKLYGQTGKFTYDPGFLSTASCSSKITFIDGDKGELLYRGYPIEELATKCDFLEEPNMFGWESLVIRVPSDRVGEAVGSPAKNALRISISERVSFASSKSLLFRGIKIS